MNTTYRLLQLRIGDDGEITAPGRIVTVTNVGHNTVTALVEIKRHRLAGALPAAQPEQDENRPEGEESAPDLDDLSYRELQKLAVEHDVKGNLPKDDLLTALREVL
jgi:hypothetical protein